MSVKQKGSRTVSGPGFSDQNKSWLKRKQQQEESGDESDDLQPDSVEGIYDTVCFVHVACDRTMTPLACVLTGKEALHSVYGVT